MPTRARREDGEKEQIPKKDARTPASRRRSRRRQAADDRAGRAVSSRAHAAGARVCSQMTSKDARAAAHCAPRALRFERHGSQADHARAALSGARGRSRASPKDRRQRHPLRRVLAIGAARRGRYISFERSSNINESSRYQKKRWRVKRQIAKTRDADEARAPRTGRPGRAAERRWKE